MLSLNRPFESGTQHPPQITDAIGNSVTMRKSLDRQFTVDPLDESFESDANADLSACDAARVYHKSLRQIQRLLKTGHLKGYKVMGPNGPEWRVCRVQVPRKGSSPPAEIVNRIQGLTSDLDVLLLKAARFEASMARIDNLAIKVDKLQSDVQTLNEQTRNNESVVSELHMLRDQQSMIDCVSNEVRANRAMLQDLMEHQQCKPAWWKRAFSQ